MRNWSFPKEQSVWKMATLFTALIFFGLSVRWSYIDNSPPAWDQGLYLYQATILHESFMQNGFIDMMVSVFNIDRGRVPLLPLLVQPTFYFFGPTLDAAVVTLNLAAWPLLAWSMPGITRFVTPSSPGNKAAFFSFLLFGLYPLTMVLSHNYLTDLLLAAFVCASIYSLFLLHESQKTRWSMFAGLFIGLGLLTKVTFAAFVLPAFCILILRDIRTYPVRVAFKLYFPAALLCVVVAGPYYFLNLKYIFQSTAHLSSANLSKLYGFGGAFDPQAILEYWKAIFANPAIVIAVVCVVVGLLFRWNRPFVKSTVSLVAVNRKPVAGIMAIWFCLPFLLATFGEIKDPRYIFPGLLPIFILAGSAMAWNSVSRMGSALMISAYIIALPGYLHSNSLISPGVARQFVSYLKMDIMLVADLPPDSRDWQANKLVREIGHKLDAYPASRTVLFLGGNRYYHLSLLNYEGLIGGPNLKYVTLPYYSDPSMNLDGALKFITESSVDGILHKSGQHWPPFSSRLDSAIISRLKDDPNYVLTDLKVEQPDGSRFVIFKPASGNVSTQTISYLLGFWLVGEKLGSIAVGDGDRLTVTTETGVKGSATIRNGEIYVPEWNVTGKCSLDFRSIYWSNGSIWTKFPKLRR